MTEADLWANRAFLRRDQYKTDANLAARQSIYAYQHPRIDLQATVLDLAAPAASDVIVDVGCGNGTYLAELARRGLGGRALGVDLSLGMLAAARERLSGAERPAALANADAAALPLRNGMADLGERVTLDDGESLAKSFFPRVTRHDFVAELRIPAPGPIADYIRSMSGTNYHADPALIVEEVLATFPRTSDGNYVITSHSGCVICETD